MLGIKENRNVFLKLTIGSGRKGASETTDTVPYNQDLMNAYVLYALRATRLSSWFAGAQAPATICRIDITPGCKKVYKLTSARDTMSHVHEPWIVI